MTFTRSLLFLHNSIRRQLTPINISRPETRGCFLGFVLWNFPTFLKLRFLKSNLLKPVLKPGKVYSYDRNLTKEIHDEKQTISTAQNQPPARPTHSDTDRFGNACPGHWRTDGRWRSNDLALLKKKLQHSDSVVGACRWFGGGVGIVQMAWTSLPSPNA